MRGIQSLLCVSTPFGVVELGSSEMIGLKTGGTRRVLASHEFSTKSLRDFVVKTLQEEVDDRLALFRKTVQRQNPEIPKTVASLFVNPLAGGLWSLLEYDEQRVECSQQCSGAVRVPCLLKVNVPANSLGLYEDLVVPVTNFHNEDLGFTVLAGDVFDVPIRKDIIHRVETHSTKTISEVSGTGRKPWRQKGIGRARHGTLRGPQFRGGATMHGPKPRSHALKLNKKVRRLGLKIALSARAAEGKLLVFEDLEVPTHKTKNIVNYVNQMENAKKLLLGLNVYGILQHDTLVMSRDAVNRIVERMHTPISR
ncbi:BAH and coiled-coil domain-containing protein 1-like [Hibiscus syriacus]|uniref:Large ribosomal subunit protein uL4m n=1 Tax=Hibiscus syriacus TaxID=106335 RepID=A0A6A3D3L9_HIBSY|nr:BAH and coiled-coil domain-containing protein 1-like [Hibiscus syriacus]